MIPAIREAGDRLREIFVGRHLFGEPPALEEENPQESVRMKNPHEMVLGVDYLSQQILVERARQLFPGRTIYSEEMDTWAHFKEDRTPKLLIDPLDGTHNYHFGIPEWGVAVSLVDQDFQPEAGLIYIPMLDLLLIGEQGKPTRLHYRGAINPTRTSSREDLSRALVAYDNQFYRLGTKALTYYQRITKEAFTTRISGSAVFDTLMVALGKFDARVWNKVEPYDVAPAFSIVRGAGGEVLDFQGRPCHNLFNGEIVICGNRRFGDALTRLLEADSHVGPA